nr:LysR family transcriptional regulator [uncultured Blautia sp.]
MDLRVLRYFLTVAKEQSFTKAAEQLHITQPTLSRQLAALEEDLGTKLFNRGGKDEKRENFINYYHRLFFIVQHIFNFC